MAEEDLDPTTIPLPPTDGTVYIPSSDAMPSSDFHSNAHDSEDENDDEVDEEANNANEHRKMSDIDEEDEKVEGQEEDEEDVTGLPTPQGKMITLTPSFNRSTRSTRSIRSRRTEPSSELSQTKSAVDEQGDHEMDDSDDLQQQGEDESEDEEMEDDENDTMHAHVAGKIARLGTGGKVKDHRGDGGAVVEEDEDHDLDIEEEEIEEQGSDEEDDEEADEDEEQGEDEEGDDEEENSDSEHDEFERTIKIPMHTPSRSAVPKRLLGNTSPGRTPLARMRPLTTTNTPAGYIPSLDFTTPGIAATSFPATVGRLNLRTPFLYHGTPINLSRPNAVQHHQLAVQNELLFEEVKEKEAQIKYLQGLVESAAASPTRPEQPMMTDAEMEELVSFDETPEKKRVRLSIGGDETPKPGELSVPKTKGKRRTSGVAATPAPKSVKKGKMSEIATPQTAFKGSPVKTLFENMTMTPSRFSVTSDNLFGTPSRIPMPQFEVKSKRQRKEDKRRRMTAQLREFSEINIDMLKGWLPGDGTIPEEAGEDGGLPIGPKASTPTPPAATAAMESVPEGAGGDERPVEEKASGEKSEKEKPGQEQAADNDGDAEMADVPPVAEEAAALPDTISVPAQIPTRQLKILAADKVLTTRKRSNSAPAVPHALITTEEDEEEDPDISISPLAQEMITALQQRCLALEREVETSNAALQKATVQLVGEMRARKAAEEVREYLETEKKFGICCDAARKEAVTQASAKKKKASTAAATATMPPPAAGKKRTRDEREGSAQLESRATGIRPTSRAAAGRPPSRATANRPPSRTAAGRPPPEKRVYSGPTTATASTSQAPPPPPTRPTRATAARAAAAKKPLGKATTNEQPRHPPITTGMEKPAVRGGATRPKSRLGDREEETAAAGRTTRARSGSAAGEAGRPMSRYGDRPVRHVDAAGLDVFGRLATGTRRR